MSCRDESNSAPTPVITMAVYSPYCGWQSGDLGVGHGLRHGHGGDGQAGHRVEAEGAA